MAIRLGDVAPDFEADTTHGMIEFHQWIGGGWAILFSHPRDFTPVCTTELGLIAEQRPEFDKRNVKVIGLSVNSIEEHVSWAKDIEDVVGTPVNFPLIADTDCSIAILYDMIHPNEDRRATVRTVFFIGPDKRVKAMMTYPLNTGRNVDELLRVIDSLQLTNKHDVATPVNWQPGDDLIIAENITDRTAWEKFPDGWNVLKPYFRVVKNAQLKSRPENNKTEMLGESSNVHNIAKG